jgi:hypothetical protein
VNDTRELLRPGVEGFEPMSDAFERVLARRDRRRRNQRVAAGVLGIVVFVLALIGLARLLGSQPMPALPEPPSPIGNGRFIVIGAQHLDTDPDAPYQLRSEPHQLFVVDADAQPRLLVGKEGDRRSRDCPSFSADGTMLAWGEKRHFNAVGGASAVVLSGFSSSGALVGPEVRIPVPVANQRLVSGPCPRWAPVGERVALFLPGHGVLFADAESDSRLVTLDEPGDEDNLSDMEWSPDGSRVAVSITPGSGTQRFIWVAPVDGGAPTRLAPSPGRSPDAIAWTPEGDAVVVAGTDERSPFVETIDIRTGAITDVRIPDAWSGSFLVQLLPAGDDRFLVMRADDTGWLPPEILDLRGNVTPIAVRGYAIASFVGLSPDGAKLLFVEYDPAESETGGALVAVPLDGGDATRYSPWTNGFGDNWGTFAWQPAPAHG